MDTGEIISEWLYGRPLTTQSAYLRDVEGLLVHLQGKPLEGVTLRDLQLWQSQLLEMRQTPATVARKASSVRGLFRHAVRHGHIERNPAIDLRSPTVHWRVHERVVSRELMLAIIEAAAPGRDRALLRLAYATLARVSELCGLLWKDCDPTPTGGATIHILGKRQKWRDAQAPPSVWAAVVELRGDAPGDAPVFGGIKRQRVGEIVKDAAIAAGAPTWFSPHKIRHTGATHMVEAGAPLTAVQALLGHERPETTLIYARSSQQKPAVDYLEW
jgi:integrase/recombinase XerD